MTTNANLAINTLSEAETASGVKVGGEMLVKIPVDALLGFGVWALQTLTGGAFEGSPTLSPKVPASLFISFSWEVL